MELFRLLQRANLTSYYDSFIAQGGDDVSQLAEANDEEFMEIMRVVNMANKPLHIRRLHKALQEWKVSPEKFRPGVNNGIGSVGLGVFGNLQQNTSANLVLGATNMQDNAGLRNYVNHLQTPIRGSISSILTPSSSGGASPKKSSHANGSKEHLVKGIPVSLLPNATLNPEQRLQIEQAAEDLIKCIPEYPVKEVTNHKAKKSHDLLEILNMPTNYPQRVTAIYKHSAIYGRFDRLRKTGKPMNHHEVAVNEAAAQLALRMPSLLTRREDLYPLARQVVRIAEDACKDFIHTKPHKKKDNSLINTIANQISAFYANDPEAGILSLQEKIDNVKAELADMVCQSDKLRQAFQSAKTGVDGISMTEVQKQLDNLTALQQTKMAEQGRLLQEVRRFRMAMKPDQSRSGESRVTSNSTFPDTFQSTSQQNKAQEPTSSSATSTQRSSTQNTQQHNFPCFSVFPALNQLKNDLPHNRPSVNSPDIATATGLLNSIFPSTTSGGAGNVNFHGNTFANVGNSLYRGGASSSGPASQQQQSHNTVVGNQFSCFPVFPNLHNLKAMANTGNPNSNAYSMVNMRNPS